MPSRLMPVRKWRATAVLASVLLIGAVVGCSGQPSAKPSSSAPPSSGPTSFEDPIDVTINVSGCDHCTIKANWSAFSSTNVPPGAWKSGSLPVTDGRVNFKVPGTFASGLSFEVHSPQNQNAEAVPVAVIHYGNVPTGQPVSAAEASASKAGYGCWAGTTEKQTTLDLTVDWIDGTDIDGNPTKKLRAFFSPGLLSLGAAVPTSNGTLSHQNVWACFS